LHKKFQTIFPAFYLLFLSNLQKNQIEILQNLEDTKKTKWQKVQAHLLHSSFLIILVILVYNSENCEIVTILTYCMVFISNSGNCEIVKVLLSKGADVNFYCHWGTPLHIAAAYGFDDAMKILLDHNADVSVTILPCLLLKKHGKCYIFALIMRLHICNHVLAI
jgi:ankyrin repeat protein